MGNYPQFSDVPYSATYIPYTRIPNHCGAMQHCTPYPMLPYGVHMFDNEKTSQSSWATRWLCTAQGSSLYLNFLEHNATPPVLQEGYIPPMTYDKSEPCNAIPPTPQISQML